MNTTHLLQKTVNPHRRYATAGLLLCNYNLRIERETSGASSHSSTPVPGDWSIHQPLDRCQVVLTTPVSLVHSHKEVYI
ncbi:hypothetical protein J6590_015175 [Homalodisca vitripennis]|nr:hypothetical protein J6590_015175 [Homalodisca vitripennis]